MAKQIYLFYECNGQKAYDSRVLLMASTQRQQIVSALKREIRKERMSFDGKTGKEGVAAFKNDDYPYADLKEAFNTKLKRGYIDIVESGKELEPMD